MSIDLTTGHTTGPATGPASGKGAAGKSSSAGPRVRRRPPLPPARAVVGGLLVAVAMLGTAVAYAGAGGEPDHTVVVVRQAVDVGRTVPPGAVVEAPAQLPDDVVGAVFSSGADVEGRVALAPLRPGEVVQRSQVGEQRADPGLELAFAIERDRAVNGELTPGDSVDVVATHGTGEGARTTVVASGAVVRRSDATGSGSLAGGGDVVLTLAVDRPEELLALAHAVDLGSVRVVRTTGTAGLGEATYRPSPGPGPGTGAGTGPGQGG